MVDYIEPVIKESKPLHGDEHLGTTSTPKAKPELRIHEIFGGAEVGRGGRIVVQGKPGSGKTTLLQKLAKMWMGGQVLTHCRVFLKIQLHRSANMGVSCITSEMSLLQDIFSLCGIISNPKIDLDAVISEVELNEVCIALDGLDEYALPHHLTDPDSFIYRVVSGKDILPLSTVIVTSRPTPLHEDFRYGSKVSMSIEIVGFDEQGIEAFVHGYFTGNKARSDKLISGIVNNPDILFTCHNPLLLTFLVYAFDLGEKLPKTETGVHIAFITAFLKQEVRRLDRKRYLMRECQFLKLSSFESVSKCSSRLGELFQAVSRLAYNGTFESTVTMTAQDGSTVELQLISPGMRYLMNYCTARLVLYLDSQSTHLPSTNME